ncbi:MAG: dipeptide epimerase, partial [Desulfosarcinaceae bacterium]
MRITAVEAWLVGMRLAQPYTIAYESIDQARNVFLRLETDTGLQAFGCSAPDQAVTGENAEKVLAAAKDIIVPMMKGRDPMHRAKLFADLQKAVGPMPSALAMVDMALYDILGKTAGLPLYQILGGFRQRML